MVRGDQSCLHLCPTCKLDCRCETTGCRICHTCRDVDTQGYNYHPRKRYYDTCVDYKHDCSTYLLKEELLNEKVVKNMSMFPKLFSSEIVEITIGKPPSETRFVPKSALIKNSEYFKRSFSFKEKSGGGSTSPIVLDTDVDNPGAFDRFIQFAYWDDYQVDNDLDIAMHGHVYVLADRLQAIPLKDLAVRKASPVVAKLSKNVNPSEVDNESLALILSVPGIIETVYLNTPPPSDERGEGASTVPAEPFRMLLAAFCACWLDRLKAHCPRFIDCVKMFPDFAADLITLLPNGKSLELDEKGYLTRV